MIQEYPFAEVFYLLFGIPFLTYKPGLYNFDMSMAKTMEEKVDNDDERRSNDQRYVTVEIILILLLLGAIFLLLGII